MERSIEEEVTMTKTIKLTATGLSGPDWIKRLEKGGYGISIWAKDLLNSPKYEKHRLIKGQEIEVVLVKRSEIDKHPTTKEVQEYAKGKGYEMPSAELSLLLRESLSDEDLKEMGVWYVVVLHDPIEDSDGDPRVLGADRYGGGRGLNAFWDGPGRQWGGSGLFAFSVPASSTENPDTTSLPSESLSALTLISETEEQLAKLKKLI